MTVGINWMLNQPSGIELDTFEGTDIGCTSPSKLNLH